MQAIILAAGFGSRLGDITEGLPKSCLKLGNETLLDRAIRILEEREIFDIIIVTGFKGDVIRKQVQGKSRVSIIDNPLFFCGNVLASFGVGMGKLTDDFIFLHADTVFAPEILDSLLENVGRSTLPVDFKKCQDEEMKVITSNGNVVQISKEIPLELAEGEFMGLAYFSKQSLQTIKEAVIMELQDNNHNAYFEAAIQRLINEGETFAVLDIQSKDWVEIDFLEDYERAKAAFVL